jgi:hypothetical protein
MKVLMFSLAAFAGLALVALQHQQLGHLRGENTTLAQAATEANQLKADLAKSAGAQAQDAAEEIARLREENRDLLRLRNEVNQLRDTKGQIEKVRAENLRLQTQVKDIQKSEVKQPVMQPIFIRLDNLYDRGLSTPEAALQTFYWAQHEGNKNALERCVTRESWQSIGNFINEGERQIFGNVVLIEIVARREIDATTVQLGIRLQTADGERPGDKKGVYTFLLKDGEWRLEMKGL